MRIVIPNFPAPDSFADNVAVTLREMGHEVTTLPRRAMGTPASPVAVLVDDLARKAFPQRWTKAERWLVEFCRETPCDMLLSLTQAIRDETLAELRRSGVRHLVAWWGDTPANMRGMGLLSDQWDHIYAKDAAAVAKLRAVGLPAELLHEAMNPIWHRPCYKAIGDHVAIAGNFYGYRQFLVKRLVERDVPLKLFGAKLPRWAAPSLADLHTGKYVIREEKSRQFGQALACLNSTALSEGDSLNCRAFEIAGAAGLQLMEDKAAISECFVPGEEILIYRSVDDIVDYLARAQREPKWALQVRYAGSRRAHSDHSYERRLTSIIGRLER